MPAMHNKITYNQILGKRQILHNIQKQEILLWYSAANVCSGCRILSNYGNINNVNIQYYEREMKWKL